MASGDSLLEVESCAADDCVQPLGTERKKKEEKEAARDVIRLLDADSRAGALAAQG